MHKLDVFQTKCLRRICNIFWPNKMSNENHILRMPQDHIPSLALRWTPTGKRSKGRPKTTWRISIIAELSDMSLTMGEAQVIVQDHKRWRNDTVALTIINSDHNINNNNIYIVVYSQHPYCCINNIVLTRFLKQSQFDVLICSLNLFHSHGATQMNERSRKVLEEPLLIGDIIS